MSIHSATYASLLSSLKALVDAQADGTTTGKASLLRVYLRRSIREHWRKFWWPELMLVEQRLFRDEYDAATAYAALDEVFYWPTGKYYICTTASTGNAPAGSAGTVDDTYWAEAGSSYSTTDWAASTAYAVGDQVRNIYDGSAYQCHTAHTSTSSFDSTKFTLLTPFVRSILLNQSGETLIGDVQGIYDCDPDVYPARAEKLRHQRTGDRLLVVPDDHNVVYVKFRKRVPDFAGADFDANATYAIGDTIYYNATDYYTATAATSAGEDPDDTPAKWALNEIPERLSECAPQRAYAEYLFTVEGQSTRAQAQKAYSDMMVKSEWTELTAGEGIINRLPVRTR